MHSRRYECRLCGSRDLIMRLPLKPIPVGEHYQATRSSEDAIRFPIDIYECKRCSAVQTQDDIDPEFLWRDYTYFSGQTKGIQNHFSEFVSEFLELYANGKANLDILDIGSNDGSLLQCFKDKGCRVQGIDPAISVVTAALSANIPTIHALWGSDKAEQELSEKTFDIITAFNVFAHSPDMNSMARSVVKHLKNDGLFCFEVQYLADISNKTILGTFFHEHMIHYSYASASAFINKFGMEIIDAWRNNIQHGSIIFICSKVGAGKQISQGHGRVKDIMGHEANEILNGSWSEKINNYILSTQNHVNSFISKSSIGPKSLCGYGAARSGPTFAIQFGLDNYLYKLLDDHPSKVGRFSPYLSLPVYPVNTLNPDDDRFCVILAYIHYKKIISENLEYLAGGGTFILLWPEFALVTIENYARWVNS